jgi:quinol monooxygenase YgiN
MNFKQLFILGALVLSLPLSGQAHAADALQDRYVQIAELEIDPAQLDRYKAAAEEQIEAAIRLEPGVLVLYAVSETENPARVRVFEVYASTGAYKAHLQAEHFRKYKRTTDPMVKSLKLVRVDPLLLGAKAQ